MAAVNLNHQEFEKLLREGKALLVDYWAPWCGYCRRIGPAYEQVAKDWEGKLTVAQTERLVEELLTGKSRRRPARPLVRDVRVFFNTVNHALDIMRRGGIPAERHRRDEEDYIEYVVRIPKTTTALSGKRG